MSEAARSIGAEQVNGGIGEIGSALGGIVFATCGDGSSLAGPTGHAVRGTHTPSDGDDDL
jgi:hypothetical protein